MKTRSKFGLNTVSHDGKHLTISAHADARKRWRRVDITDERAARIIDAVALADSKGAKETLVLIDGAAFIVANKNRVIKTIMAAAEFAMPAVFTNIDCTVIA